jgi:hypothetical protein
MARLMGLPGQKTPHGKTLHYEIIHSKITARIGNGGADHIEYETVSILKLIEKRLNL